MTRTMVMITMLFVFTAAPSAMAGEPVQATMYKSVGCPCCDGHADHLRSNGYEVEVREVENMSQIKTQFGVPEALEGCHSISVGGYVVEGHVPANVIDRLMREHPDIRGISLPGMPLGAPGMGGEKEGPFEIIEISDGERSVYAVE